MLGVLRGVANRLPILLFCVASPHTVNGYLASKEIVRTLFEHCGVTELYSNLIILAIPVSVSEKTNLVRIWGDLLQLDSEFVLGSALLPIVKWVEDHLVVEGRRIRQSAMILETTHYLFTYI